MARILLVDDDRDIRELGRALLATSGHDVFVADSVLPALQLLQQTPIDLLIADINMPQHSGFDMVRTIKRDGRWPDLIIAMLTGRRERKDIETALGLGVNDYIVKPLDPLLFMQKVKDLLERHLPANLETSDVEFALIASGIPAHATTTVEVRAVSEVGLLLRGTHPFSEGQRLEIESDLFAQMGIAPPAMKVLSSVEADGNWETRVTFVGADERALTRIRAWVHANASKTGRGAA